jgi:hypothetical protein
VTTHRNTKKRVVITLKSLRASSVVITLKKVGSIRFCIDYRRLNDVIIKYDYRILRIDDTLDALQHAQYVSTLDFRSSYWQMELDYISQQMIAFVTYTGLLESIGMPLGLMNSPATFEHLLNVMLAGLK